MSGPLDLLDVQREALERGDECHHRTEAGSKITHDALAPWLPDDVKDFILGNGQFFLNLAMVSAKLATVCASGVPGSSLLTVIAPTDTADVLGLSPIERVPAAT